MTTSMNRRSLLRLGGAAGLGLAILPGLRRLARAVGPGSHARRVLVINLAGGVRSSAAFHASSQEHFNPWFMMAGSAATQLRLGAVLDDFGLPDTDYQLGPAWGGVRAPRLREIANELSVVGTWSEARGDHALARVVEPTGSPGGSAPGLLTRIAVGFDRLATATGLPPFHLTPTAQFGFATGDLVSYAPVAVSGAGSMPKPATQDPVHLAQTGNDWAADDAMRAAYDHDKVENRHSVAGLVTSTLALHRRAARAVGERVTQPDIVLSDPNGTAGGVTNAALLEVFTRAASHAPALAGYGVNAALAVRLLQADSPAVCMEIGNFDLHSNERDGGPPLYTFLGRLLASLQFVMSRVPDPLDTSSTLLDRTLVVTMSDFGRDRGTVHGYNGGEGSDHGADTSCFYLAHAMMGGGIRRDRVFGAADTNTYDGRGVGYAPDRMLATVLDALGLDALDEEYGLPQSSPIAELWS
jgi:uncharacterized protein (DUF1501 family)